MQRVIELFFICTNTSNSNTISDDKSDIIQLLKINFKTFYCAMQFVLILHDVAFSGLLFDLYLTKIYNFDYRESRLFKI